MGLNSMVICSVHGRFEKKKKGKITSTTLILIKNMQIKHHSFNSFSKNMFVVHILHLSFIYIQNNTKKTFQNVIIVKILI